MKARAPVRSGAPLLAELRSLLSLAVPLIVSHLATVGMTTVDTLMVAPLGATPLAALAVGSALHVAMTMVGLGVILGMTPLVSQAFGAGRRRECRRVLVQGIWLALLLSLPMVGLSLAGRPLALVLGQPAAVAEPAGGYLAALAWGIPPLLAFMALRQYVEGMGITRPTMVFLLLGFALNVPANRVLIYGVDGWIPALGLVGSGHATSAVRATLLLGMVGYLARHRVLRPLRGVRLLPRARRLMRIVRIGLPVGGQIGLEVGLFSFSALAMGWFGTQALAAHQVTINLAATTFMVALGSGLAGTIRVGQHIGAGRADEVHRAATGTYVLAVGFMSLCALAFFTIPDTLLGLYTREPGILELGRRLLFLAALFQVFDGAQVAGMCVLRGAADTRVPMALAAVGYWLIGVPTGLLLAFPGGLGPEGVWVGLTAGLASVAVLLVFRVRRMLWQPRLPTPAEPPPATPSL